MAENLKKMAKDVPSATRAGPGKEIYYRPMKFPYTFTAKIAQFPWKFYYQNSWSFRYYAYGLIASLPFIIYIHRKANSPANKAWWKELKRKEMEEHKFK